MGKLEKEVKIQTRRQNIRKVILGTIATAGIIGVMAVAPNAIQALAMLDGGRHRRRTNPKYSVNATFSKLLRDGMICLEKNDHGKFVSLTEAGRRQLRAWGEYKYFVEKPKKWDKKWRIIIFDIKTKRNNVRDQLRKTLKHMGFIQLQRSVWVYPYDCEDFIILLKADYKIGKDVLYLIVDRIENDRDIKSHFGLK
jgi:cellulose synthase/poly-beta-1,6-N-acetylglucosamine synthase-like glycosyltransferase